MCIRDSFLIGRASVGEHRDAGQEIDGASQANGSDRGGSGFNPNAIRGFELTESRYLPSSIRRRASRGMALHDLSPTDNKFLFDRAVEACQANFEPLLLHELANKKVVARTEGGNKWVTHIPKPPPPVRDAILKEGLAVFEEHGEFSLPEVRKILTALEKKIYIRDHDLFISATRKKDDRLELAGYLSLIHI